MSWMGIVEMTGIGPIHVAAGAEDVGPPILYLHGVTRHWRDWAPITAALSQRWRPYCLDFRGHGESARAEGAYRVINYVDDAVHIARQVIGRPFVVMGHSLGAMVACAVAERLRDQVMAVILEDPPFETMGVRIKHLSYLSQFQGIQQILREECWHDVGDFARQLAEMEIQDPHTSFKFRLGDIRDESFLRFQASCLAKIDPDVLTTIIAGEWMAGFPWEKFVAAIECPILLLKADTALGGMLVDEDAARVRELARDVSTINFPGVGHQLHWMASETYLRVVNTFLESLPVEHPF